MALSPEGSEDEEFSSSLRRSHVPLAPSLIGGSLSCTTHRITHISPEVHSFDRLPEKRFLLSCSGL